MNFVFPAQRIIEKTVTINPITNERCEHVSNGGYFLLSQADEELLFSKIKYDITIFFLWNMTEHRDVWSVIFFPEPINDSGKVLEARGDLKNQIIFAAYGDVIEGMRDPPLGAFSIQSKSAIRNAANRHPIFAQTWEILKDQAESQNWVIFIELN